ncbi:hypothetical protein os1_22740 [Comamonadaceae bacterium OS-1]|nr:hypothetical protein os1_22740 [Comamonadaceae bacterium OS-1]
MREWREVSIGAHLKLTSGFPFASSHFSNEGTPLIRIRDVLTSNTETYFNGAFPPGYIIKRGNILIGMDGDFHIVRWRGCDALLNQRVLKVDVQDESVVVLDYLYHWLGPFVKKINDVTAATTVKHLSTKDLTRARTSVPPVVTQRRIAAILTSIDTAIEKTEALVAKYQQIKAGLMHDLLTRGVLPDGTLRPSREQAPELYHETTVGLIPREWNLSDCGQMFAIDSGITLGPHRRPAKRPHAYLRVANIHRDEIRLHDVAKLEALPGETEYSLKKYDLLVVEGHANRSEIGRCAMVFDDAEGMLFQNHLFRLRSSILDAQYALLWMNSHHAQRYWESACATSSGLNTINKKMLRSMAVCVPSNNEQKQIAETAFTIRQMLRTEADKLRKLQHQKLGLMQDLLTGKVPVQPVPEPLDTTDA